MLLDKTKWKATNKFVDWPTSKYNHQVMSELVIQMNASKPRSRALNIAHQTHLSLKRKRKTTVTQPKKQQSFLDFGQKSFKQYEVCRKCAFLFSNGVEVHS